MANPPSAQNRTSWLLLSILYVVLFSFPLLQVFNRHTLLFGIPLLIFYLLLGWLLFIWVIYRYSRRLGKDSEVANPGHDREQQNP
jgi:hypothetical protein